MWSGAETLELQSNVFTILRDLIHDRTGLFYDDGKRQLLAEKLSPYAVERGFSSFLDFYYLLKYGPGEDAEWPKVLDTLSVQETYFWREMGQINALVNDVLPTYVRDSSSRTIRIWCAACATGEEPLTIAMALAESGWLRKADFEIAASDGSPTAIAAAQRGVYRERSFRALPSKLREKYFLPNMGVWQARPELFPPIRWSRANLANGAEITALADVSFVFCRNVFIYFSEDAISRTLSHFASQMKRPGYLFVGASESLLRLTEDFDLDMAGDAFVYLLR